MLVPGNPNFDDALDSCKTYLNFMMTPEKKPEPEDAMRDLCSTCKNLSIYFDRERIARIMDIVKASQSAMQIAYLLRELKSDDPATEIGTDMSGGEHSYF